MHIRLRLCGEYTSLTHISPRIYGDVDGNVGMLAVFRTKVRVSG
jgi:hypothetical protein